MFAEEDTRARADLRVDGASAVDPSGFCAWPDLGRHIAATRETGSMTQ